MQPQLDLVRLAEGVGQLTLGVVTADNQLRPLFDQEDVDLFTGGALERLGNWLMLDSDRLRDGEDMLRNVGPPQLWRSESLSVIIGLHNDPNRSLIGFIRKNSPLIAATLFLQGCATCLTTEDSSTIIYELMQLTGISRDYPLEGRAYHRFMEALNECQQYMPANKTAKTIYDELSAKIYDQSVLQQIDLREQNCVAEMKQMAKMVYDAIEGLKNTDNKLIALKGTRYGSWLAALLIWLRPKEVQVLVRKNVIYPDPLTMENSQFAKTRLWICLGEAPGYGAWSIETWTETTGPPSTKIENKLKDADDRDSEKFHALPLYSAKTHIAGQINNKDAIDAIGHLAAALVIVALEKGLLHDIKGHMTRKLLDICSSQFHSTHNTVLSHFGWSDGRIDRSRLENTVKALRDAVLHGSSSDSRGDKSDEPYLGCLVEKACRIYGTKENSPMLCGGDVDTIILEQSVHLAGESLLFALCAKVPPSRNCLYRPLNSTVHATMLRQFLDHQINHPRSLGFWDLRKQTIERLVPGAPDFKPEDLAVAGDGYVALSATLMEWGGELTDERLAASIYLLPGPLKKLMWKARCYD